MRRFGRLDVLASIAGVAVNAPLASTSYDWNRMIDVNLRGVLHGIAAACRSSVSNRGTSSPSRPPRPTRGYRPGRLRRHQVRGARPVRGDATGTGSRGPALHAHLAGLYQHRFHLLHPRPQRARVATTRRDAMAMPPQAVAETIAFAIAQPDSVDIGEVIVLLDRPALMPLPGAGSNFRAHRHYAGDQRSDHCPPAA